MPVEMKNALADMAKFASELRLGTAASLAPAAGRGGQQSKSAGVFDAGASQLMNGLPSHEKPVSEGARGHENDTDAAAGGVREGPSGGKTMDSPSYKPLESDQKSEVTPKKEPLQGTPSSVSDDSHAGKIASVLKRAQAFLTTNTPAGQAAAPAKTAGQATPAAKPAVDEAYEVKRAAAKKHPVEAQRGYLAAQAALEFLAHQEEAIKQAAEAEELIIREVAASAMKAGERDAIRYCEVMDTFEKKAAEDEGGDGKKKEEGGSKGPSKAADAPPPAAAAEPPPAPGGDAGGAGMPMMPPGGDPTGGAGGGGGGGEEEALQAAAEQLIAEGHSPEEVIQLIMQVAGGGDAGAGGMGGMGGGGGGGMPPMDPGMMAEMKSAAARIKPQNKLAAYKDLLRAGRTAIKTAAAKKPKAA